jgi:hypothetical protein
LIVSVSVDEVLVAKLASPLNTATIECEPAESCVVHVAAPFDTGTAPHPEMVVPPDVNATVLSLTVLVLVTVAVKVSLWGKVAGLTEAPIVVVVDLAKLIVIASTTGCVGLPLEVGSI